MSLSAVSSPSPSYHDLQAMVMGFGVVSFIAILLLVVAIITAVVLYACELLYIYTAHTVHMYTWSSAMVATILCMVTDMLQIFMWV